MLKDVIKSMEPQNNGQFYFWFQDYATALKPFTIIFSCGWQGWKPYLKLHPNIKIIWA